MTEILDSLMTQSMAMISVAARLPQVLVKISLRPFIHWCLYITAKNGHKEGCEKAIQLFA